MAVVRKTAQIHDSFLNYVVQHLFPDASLRGSFLAPLAMYSTVNSVILIKTPVRLLYRLLSRLRTRIITPLCHYPIFKPLDSRFPIIILHLHSNIKASRHGDVPCHMAEGHKEPATSNLAMDVIRFRCCLLPSSNVAGP